MKEKLARAKMAIRPDVGAAFVISEFGGHSDVAALAVQLEIGMNDVRKNDFRECEAMLYSQAHALQAIFVDALLQVKNLAQSKNPPAVFARQANIAQGPQQVNNAMPAGEPLARGENKNTPNKLLEEKPHERLDTRTPGAAVGSDPAMTTLGTFDGAEVRRG